MDRMANDDKGQRKKKNHDTYTFHIGKLESIKVFGITSLHLLDTGYNELAAQTNLIMVMLTMPDSGQWTLLKRKNNETKRKTKNMNVIHYALSTNRQPEYIFIIITQN